VTRIAGLDVSSKGLQETASVLSKSYPAIKFLPITADLTSESAVKGAVARTVAEFGAIHYAANNAGIGRPFGPTSETDTEDFDRVTDVNTKGVWLCEKYELEQMLKQEPRQVNENVPGVLERGSIVVTSSTLGLRAMPNLSVYNMTKHAVLGLTRTDAIDYARRGIRVNAVCPGFVDTPLLIDSTKKALASTIDRIPQGRLANPEEVADSVCFLASGLSSHITGVALPVDGGLVVT
jgi:NAD(P)-dependent dehydrogenase (short-subunit alcohol dehydrogenase family)